MYYWTSEEIEKVLIQLEERNLPFPDVAFIREKERLKLLGHGGSAVVFAARHKTIKKLKYAMKVIGFSSQKLDSDSFETVAQAQFNMALFNENLVQVTDFLELWITLDEKDNVVTASMKKTETSSDTLINLQFVLMEELTPVMVKKTSGFTLFLENLSNGDEQEILKIAHDIGLALKKIHDGNVLHRDVKLENIFYSEKNKRYKLGDFGIAKKTEDGFANTIAFTNGYAAPEVRFSEERYDKTADIYSFGMMLYVLANKLKFPDSDTYLVNSDLQYQKGYTVPKPDFDISDELYHIIAKACMYDPDQRYQSVDEMLLDIEKIRHGIVLGYEIEHKNDEMIVGMVMLALGIVAWKITMEPNMIIKWSIGEFIFLLVCLGKGITQALECENKFLSVLVLGLGIYILVATGFSWLKLVLLVWTFLSPGTGAGIFAGGVLLAGFVSWFQQFGSVDWHSYSKYSWIAVAAILISVMMFYHFFLLGVLDEFCVNSILRYGILWSEFILLFTVLLIFGCVTSPTTAKDLQRTFGSNVANTIMSINMKLVGITGLGFCLIWIVRERLLISHQKESNGID